MYAFKCRTCGHLEDGDNAGEHSRPRACRNCGAGCSVDPLTLQQVPDPENWIVLAELSKDELGPILTFHKIKKSHIKRHVPARPVPADRAPTVVDRSLEDSLTVEENVG